MKVILSLLFQRDVKSFNISIEFENCGHSVKASSTLVHSRAGSFRRTKETSALPKPCM